MSKIHPLQFTGPSILVIGDIMLDEYIYTEHSKVSPEAPVIATRVSRREYRAGGSANVALNISKLGIKCEVLATIGDDDAGKNLERIFKENNVKKNLIKRKKYITTLKTRVWSQNHQLIRIDEENYQPLLFNDGLENKITKASKNKKVIIISDYGKGTAFESKKIIASLNKNNKFVIVDPKRSDFSNYFGASLITPNEKEFEEALGTIKSEEDIINKALMAIKKYKLGAILLTRSEKGMIYISSNEVYKNHTKAKEVYDVTGAGDTVVASIAAAINSGYNIKDAIEIGNIAAGIVISKIGTSSISSIELNRAFSNKHTKKIFSIEDLIEIKKNLNKGNQKLVMTNGCFDILHAGHVSYLSKARESGDFLVIALNSDKSVKRLKGKNRPINNLKNRISVLSSLKFVDGIVVFDQDTPIELYKKITPDILCKGADYSIKNIIGADIVKKKGGSVLRINYVDGLSTSNILRGLND